MLQNVANCYKMLHDPKICYVYPKCSLSENFIKIEQLEAKKKWKIERNKLNFTTVKNVKNIT